LAQQLLLLMRTEMTYTKQAQNNVEMFALSAVLYYVTPILFFVAF